MKPSFRGRMDGETAKYAGKPLNRMAGVQGLSQDFKNACPKQQFQKFCLSRFKYSSTYNPYTNYI